MKNAGFLVIIVILILSTLAFAYLWTVSTKTVVEETKVRPQLEPSILIDLADDTGKEEVLSGDPVYVDSFQGEEVSRTDEKVTYAGTVEILNEQLVPIQSAEVHLATEFGNQAALTRLITDEDGKVEFEFEFPLNTDWQIEVVDIVGEEIHYAPELNKIRILEGAFE